MATWYRPANPVDDRLWVYSERGLMSYAFVKQYAENPGHLLNGATNGLGETLQQVVGEVQSHRCLTEFELGNNGFGSPDGGLLFQNSSQQASFVFVEAKTQPWVTVVGTPTIQTAAGLEPLTQNQLDALCRGNNFNSKLNGQLELRWRFANAHQNAMTANTPLVRENVNLPAQLLGSDRFYWRKRLQPNQQITAHWRRVNLGAEGHLPFQQSLQQVGDRFYLLAITADKQRPQLEEAVRLFGLDNQPLPEQEKRLRLFWLSYAALQGLMEQVPANA